MHGEFNGDTMPDVVTNEVVSNAGVGPWVTRKTYHKEVGGAERAQLPENPPRL